MSTVLVKNADRMMNSVEPTDDGIAVTFADGTRGVVPFADIPEVGARERLASLDLPNLYMLVLHTVDGEEAEIPWDFVRHYCDPTYRQRVEAVGEAGGRIMGKRIRSLRERVGWSQQRLADEAGMGRVTLVRIEQGGQSPRYDTLSALAKALGVPLRELLTGD